MSDSEKLISIVLEGEVPEDFIFNLKNGMGIKEIYQGSEKLYERQGSYVFIELDSKLGANASTL